MVADILFWLLTGSVVTLAGLHIWHEWQISATEDVDMPYVERGPHD